MMVMVVMMLDLLWDEDQGLTYLCKSHHERQDHGFEWATFVCAFHCVQKWDGTHRVVSDSCFPPSFSSCHCCGVFPDEIQKEARSSFERLLPSLFSPSFSFLMDYVTHYLRTYESVLSLCIVCLLSLITNKSLVYLARLPHPFWWCLVVTQLFRGLFRSEPFLETSSTLALQSWLGGESTPGLNRCPHECMKRCLLDSVWVASARTSWRSQLEADLHLTPGYVSLPSLSASLSLVRYPGQLSRARPAPRRALINTRNGLPSPAGWRTNMNEPPRSRFRRPNKEK